MGRGRHVRFDQPRVTVPDQASEEGTIVRFYFVARDDRGGVDWTERALCLVP